jgi:protein gp37
LATISGLEESGEEIRGGDMEIRHKQTRGGECGMSNMYDWVSNIRPNHLAGRCEHECVYCYIDHIPYGRPEKYKGSIRLAEKEFTVKYRFDTKPIFVEDCNDLFAASVPDGYIKRILAHYSQYPLNTYCLQSKNPARILHFIDDLPPKHILGTTIETNRPIPSTISKAPSIDERVAAMIALPSPKFVTCEPIMDFDLGTFAQMIIDIEPSYVNIGEDTKRHNLPEPKADKVKALIGILTSVGIEIKPKKLERILGT